MSLTNTEIVFQIAGMLSNPAQDPRHLQLLVRVKSNRAAYKPDWKSILHRYKQMFQASYEEDVPKSDSVEYELSRNLTHWTMS